ncbi:MAG: carbon storage regulator [Clostridiales bacterium]|nr:carbon storage regulator [Clostridiales bacterium]
MLILSRKTDESLIIEVEGLDEPVEIIITELSANQVRLGIQAPQGCKIWRKELLQTVEYNKQAAAAASASGIRGVASQLTNKAKAPEKISSGEK